LCRIKQTHGRRRCLNALSFLIHARADNPRPRDGMLRSRRGG
jgi:hypothetical protein